MEVIDRQGWGSRWPGLFSPLFRLHDQIGPSPGTGFHQYVRTHRQKPVDLEIPAQKGNQGYLDLESFHGDHVRCGAPIRIGESHIPDDKRRPQTDLQVHVPAKDQPAACCFQGGLFYSRLEGVVIISGDDGI